MGSRAIKGRKGTKVKNKKTAFLMALSVFCAACVVGVIGAFSLCMVWLNDLPDYSDVDVYTVNQPTVIYASDGETVLAEFQMENRQPVELDDVSPYVVEGTVATEDERFYEHNGIDVWGIGRAVFNNVLGGDIEGASTITMQFVRNTLLADEMSDITFKRKVREAYIALKLEEQNEKNDILSMYLNTINYGSGAYGIEAASRRYFSKSASELTLNEAAILIGIPQSPTYNNPIDNPENCLLRRDVVLDRMVSNNIITVDEADATKAEGLDLSLSTPPSAGMGSYPYFTAYVRNSLLDEDGKYAFSSDDLYSGGYTIYTTLDLEDQAAAEEAAANKQAQAGDGFEVALAAVEPDTGFIRALVGGPDYSATQVNMATGEGSSGRQPGSSFKTFTLAAAIEEGIDPETTVDAGTTAEFPGWKVSNINHVNYGTRSISSAFAVSSNTAFARLCLALTPAKVIDMAHRLGIKSNLEEIPSVTLGSSSVSPLEMAVAYATLANGGTRYDAEPIEKIVNRQGEVIVDNTTPTGERVISEEVAAATVDVMKNVVTNGTGTAAALSSGQEAAGKTGTSENYKDSWFCGITPQMSVAIWLGDRSDYVNAKSIPGGVTAASTFSDFLNRIITKDDVREFPTAKKPAYESDYSNSEYHIGGYYGSGTSASDSQAYDGAPTTSQSGGGSTSNDTSSAPSYSDDSGNTGGGFTDTGGPSDTPSTPSGGETTEPSGPTESEPPADTPVEPSVPSVPDDGD